MALKWSLPNNTNEDRSRLEVVIFATIHTGINKITESNYEQFYQRYREIQIASGRSGADMGLEDVKGHIGLSTNAETLTNAAFNKKLLELMHRRSAFILRAEGNGVRPNLFEWNDMWRARRALADKYDLTDEYATRIVDLVTAELGGLPVAPIKKEEEK